MGWEDTKNPDTGAPLVGWKDPKTGRISNDPNEGFGAGSIPLWGSAPARGGSSSSSQPSTPAASAGGGGGGGGGGGSNRPTLSSGQLDDIRSEYHENTGRNITDSELQQYASRYTGNNFQSIIDSLEALDVAGTNPGGKPKSGGFFSPVTDFWEDTTGSFKEFVKDTSGSIADNSQAIAFVARGPIGWTVATAAEGDWTTALASVPAVAIGGVVAAKAVAPIVGAYKAVESVAEWVENLTKVDEEGGGGGGGEEGGGMEDMSELMSGASNWADWLSDRVPSLDYGQLMNQSYADYQRRLADLRAQATSIGDENLARMYRGPDGIASLALLNSLSTTGPLNAAAAIEMNNAISRVYPTYYSDVVTPAVLAQKRSAALGEVYANDIVPSLMQHSKILSDLGLSDTYRTLVDPKYKEAATAAMNALPGTVDDRLATQRLAESRALQQMYQGVQSAQMLDAAAPGLMAAGIRERATVAGLAQRQLQSAPYLRLMDAEGADMLARAISIEEQVSEAARTLLSGEVPADVADSLERVTAERMGAKSPQVAANTLARNLGLTSLDLMGQGQQMAQTAAGLRSQTPALGLQLWAGRQAPVSAYTGLAQAGAQMSSNLAGLSDSLTAARLSPYAQALALAGDAASYGTSVTAALQQSAAPAAARLALAQSAMGLAAAPSDAFGAATSGLMRPAATGAEAMGLVSQFVPQLVSPASLYSNMLGTTSGLATVQPVNLLQVGAGLTTNLSELSARLGIQNQNTNLQSAQFGANMATDIYGLNLSMEQGDRYLAAMDRISQREAAQQERMAQMNFLSNIFRTGVTMYGAGA